MPGSQMMPGMQPNRMMQPQANMAYDYNRISDLQTKYPRQPIPENQ